MAFSFAAGTRSADSAAPRHATAARSGPIERIRVMTSRIARMVNGIGARGGREPPRFDPAVIEDAVAEQLYGERSRRAARRKKDVNGRRG